MDEPQLIKQKHKRGCHPNSKKNLECRMQKAGQPAHSPNVGRPPGSISLKERLDRYLYLPTKVSMPDGTITDREVMDSIVLGLLSKARKGDVPAAKEVLDRYYGKQVEKVELTGSDGKPIEVEHSARLSGVYERASNAFGERPGYVGPGPAANGPVLLDGDRVEPEGHSTSVAICEVSRGSK